MNSSNRAPFALRRGRESDTQGIYELSLRALRVSAAGHYSGAQLEAWASLRTPESHARMIRDTFLLIAENGGRLCGFANLQVETGLVDQLFVDPADSGRGIGASLLMALEGRAVSASLTHVFARASKRAVRVFEQCGYERLEVEQVSIDGEILERFLVRKALQ